MKKTLIGLMVLTSSASSTYATAVSGYAVGKKIGTEGNITKYESVGFIGQFVNRSIYYSVKTRINGANMLCKMLGHSQPETHTVVTSGRTCGISRVAVDFFNLFEPRAEGKFMEFGKFCDPSGSNDLKKVYGSLNCID